MLRRRLDAVLEHCQFILGPEVTELEQRLAEFCGAAHCVGLSSGTDALQIALMAEGIGRGDAVFLPAFTYTATAEVPLVLGATPVFVDVDPRTFQIDPAHLQRRVDEVRAAGRLRPRALIGVDLFGQPADWPALRSDRDARRAVHARRLRSKFWRGAARSPFGHLWRRDGDQLLSVEVARRLWRRRRAVDRQRRARGALPQPAHAWRGHDTLRGAADRHERPAGHDAGGGSLLAKMTVFAEELHAGSATRGTMMSGWPVLVRMPARVPDSTSAWAIYAILLPNSATRGPRCRPALKAAGVPQRDLLPAAAAPSARLPRAP